MIKIKNSSFEESVIKKMSLKEFKESHKHLKDSEKIYEQITGKSENKQDKTGKPDFPKSD